ncbi:MAG: hypothetical protein EOO88_01370 [Pedobacter sp.]|nr:MAG: hypothetical protein EOO88_01370 [Pedobacter sp.]
MIACKKDQQASPEKVDKNKKSVEIMNAIRPKLYGTWIMKRVDVKAILTARGEIGIQKDTTLTDFANLTVTLVDNYSQPLNDINNDVTGFLSFRAKAYPVGFRMMASPSWLSHSTGPQTVALFDYRFPVGTHIVGADEQYLRYLTVVGDNYTIQVSDDGKTMVWKGLNRAIRQIDFVKQN